MTSDNSSSYPLQVHHRAGGQSYGNTQQRKTSTIVITVRMNNIQNKQTPTQFASAHHVPCGKLSLADTMPEIQKCPQ